MHYSTLYLATLPALLPQAAAWGDLGHRTVAYLAQNHLKPATVTYLHGVLGVSGDDDFSDGATWPDRIKRARPHTKEWHYIDARDKPPASCGLQYPADCTAQGADGCIISAIANQTAIFTDSAKTSTERNEALMFVMHLIGDLHQPLHTEGAFRGGNDIHVCFKRACSGNNLHSVWDTYIPHTMRGLKHAMKDNEEREAAKEWADELFSAQRVAGIEPTAECADLRNPTKCPLRWAVESNKLICSYVFQPSVEDLVDTDVSTDYYDGAAPIVEDAISKAGLRLAAWLEAMVKAAKASSASEGEQSSEQFEL